LNLFWSKIRGMFRAHRTFRLDKYLEHPLARTQRPDVRGFRFDAAKEPA